MQYTALHGVGEELPDMQKRPGAFGRLERKRVRSKHGRKGRDKVVGREDK